MYFTSYFANFGKIPIGVIPVAICGKAPDWWRKLQYKKLAPSWSIWSEWKYDHHNNDIYTARFNNEILANLDVNIVMRQLLELTEGKPFCLMCYEKPGDFCHRHLVADWMKSAGINIEEYMV